MMSDPAAYFLTFHTYGTWLPGHSHGSVDDEHNRPGTPWLAPDPLKREVARRQLKQDVVELETDQRRIVLAAVVEAANFRRWIMHAVHVRTTHVHVVVTAGVPPERVLNDFKTRATRRLREASAFDGKRIWSRHGSTRYLWKEDHVAAAVHYSLYEQGDITPGTIYPEVAPSEPRTSVSGSVDYRR